MVVETIHNHTNSSTAQSPFIRTSHLHGVFMHASQQLRVRCGQAQTSQSVLVDHRLVVCIIPSSHHFLSNLHICLTCYHSQGYAIYKNNSNNFFLNAPRYTPRGIMRMISGRSGANSWSEPLANFERFHFLYF